MRTPCVGARASCSTSLSRSRRGMVVGAGVRRHRPIGPSALLLRATGHATMVGGGGSRDAHGSRPAPHAGPGAVSAQGPASDA